MKRLTQKLKAAVALMLCVIMASGSLTAFAEENTEETNGTSILSDNFDELERRAQELQQPEALSEDEGIVQQTYANARSADFTIDLTVGSIINYNGYQTHQYSLSDGTVVYCIEPTRNNPSGGSYTASLSGDSLLSAVAYYGYGEPGYESEQGMYHMLADNVRPYAYVITHMALSYVYDGCSDDTDAFKGNQDSAEGIKRMVAAINNYTWMVPSDFAAFTVGTGGQTMGFGYYYNPTGYVNLIKTSANLAISDGNSCYSLKDAVYGVYSDAACTIQVGTLITDEAGNSNAVELKIGTYWVKEITAPKGFALDTMAHEVTITNGQTATVSVTDAPQLDPVRITLGKVDADTNANRPQGSASLEGAEFTIKYYNGIYDVNPAKQGKNANRTWVLRTDADGFCFLLNSYKVSGDDFFYALNGDVSLPLGTITIQETKAPKGYLVNDEVFIRQVTANGDIEAVGTYNQPVILEQSIRGGVKIQKLDYETGSTTTQGAATLAGGEIAIVNMNDNEVAANGSTYAKGETIMTLVTDANGTAQTTADALPYGDYKLVETKAPAGYVVSGVTERTFSIRENGVIVDMTSSGNAIQDKVARGGVKLQKRDYETNDNKPMGGATFEGAEIAIITESANPIIVNGKTYNKGDIVLTLTTDAAGAAQTGANVLPYGAYKAVELKAPAGYLLSGTLTQDFSITMNGVLVDLTKPAVSIKDKVKRGDFELRKIDSESQDSMAGVSFTITNCTTGESHSFTTDENGYYSSENKWNPHSQNTNGGGAEDGLWFGQTAGGVMASADDALGALPYGMYTIDEVEGINNAGKEMFHGVLYIKRNGNTINLGNIENYGDSPEIMTGTSASEQTSGTQFAPAAEEVTIIDAVALDGLVPGREYTIKGMLMDKDTKAPLLIDEEEVTAEYTFTADKISDTIDMTYTLNGSNLQGKTIVVYESLVYRGKEVASHESIKDKAQSIYFPVIVTSLKDDVTTSHIAAPAKEMKLTDTVSYNGLIPDTEYTMKGVLMDKATGEAFTVDGKEITQEVTFTPKNSDGSVELTFTFDGSALMGKTLVAFESCLYDGKEIAVHHDITDAKQTVQIPEIQTELKDKVTGTHEALAAKKMTLVDTVPYENLIPDMEYTMKGVLMDKESGKALLIDGKEVTQEVTFTPEKSNGSVELVFTFDGSTLAGKSVVAFESCYYQDKEVAVHHDITSEEQTVTIPKIETELTDKESGKHEVLAASEMTLVDTVPYENLIPGREYTMKGVLMDKESGKALLIDDKEVTQEVTFTPEKSNGSVELVFTFDGSTLAGKSVVAFESCYYEDKEIAVHHDITSEEQTVTIPKIETELTDKESGKHEVLAASEMTLVDTVPYENLIPGREYTMKGVLMDKESGKALLIDDKEVTQEVTFTPEKSNGSVELVFTFDGSTLAGKSVVAFESCYYEDKEIAVHHDITSEEQTVTIPKIETELTDKESGKHEVLAASEMTLVDAVPYENLIPGREYTMKGILMDKESGKALLIDGKEVTQEVTFTPEKSNGSVELIFTFDGSSLGGKSVVAFETCLTEDREIAVHHDITSAKQSVSVLIPPQPPVSVEPKTGDNTPLNVLAGILAAAFATLILCTFLRRKKKHQNK